MADYKLLRVDAEVQATFKKVLQTSGYGSMKGVIQMFMDAFSEDPNGVMQWLISRNHSEEKKSVKEDQSPPKNQPSKNEGFELGGWHINADEINLGD